MGAIIETHRPIPKTNLEWLDRIVFGDLDAGICHQLDRFTIQPLRSLPVENDVDGDMRAGAFGQRLGELAANISLPINVGLEIDGTPSAADRSQHRGENLGSVA